MAKVLGVYKGKLHAKAAATKIRNKTGVPCRIEFVNNNMYNVVEIDPVSDMQDFIDRHVTVQETALPAREIIRWTLTCNGEEHVEEIHTLADEMEDQTIWLPYSFMKAARLCYENYYDAYPQSTFFDSDFRQALGKRYNIWVG